MLDDLSKGIGCLPQNPHYEIIFIAYEIKIKMGKLCWVMVPKKYYKWYESLRNTFVFFKVLKDLIWRDTKKYRGPCILLGEKNRNKEKVHRIYGEWHHDTNTRNTRVTEMLLRSQRSRKWLRLVTAEPGLEGWKHARPKREPLPDPSAPEKIKGCDTSVCNVIWIQGRKPDRSEIIGDRFNFNIRI